MREKWFLPYKDGLDTVFLGLLEVVLDHLIVILLAYAWIEFAKIGLNVEWLGDAHPI